MTLPNTLSIGRIITSPLIFVLIILPGIVPASALPVWILLWVIFLGAELSDLLDGYLARRLNQVSDAGKVLDPLSDVVLHSMLLMGLIQGGIIPSWFMVLFILRELSTTGIRMVLLSQGTALAAGSGGKIKSFLLAVGSGFGLYALGVTWDLTPDFPLNTGLIAQIILGAGLVMSWTSFILYLRAYFALQKAA